ncbi:MAG: hypothetical protein PHU85_13360 [Phycisphaerae bacterium]|nr:hypothetical protein [Phycisphaerae bacterium]
MDAERAAQELKVIRELMERPIRYSTMSGLSGIIAGLAALAGVFADNYISRRLPCEAAVAVNCLVWLAVFVTALAANIVLTRIRERRQGMPFWSPVKRRILMTILPPFVAGVGLTAAIMFRSVTRDGPNEWGLIPPIWMAFYGVTCWQVAEFSIPPLRVMGAAFILASIFTATFWQATSVMAFGMTLWTPYVALGVTFGGFHIIYGAYIWKRYGG